MLGSAYKDPVTNRALAFLDAVLGPKTGLATLRRIRALRVGIAGCGGIGSSVAYLLAGLGVKEFVLVDPDVVEQGNLARQPMYRLVDIGSSKVSCLKLALEERFESLRVVPVARDALDRRSVAALEKVGLVVCAGDEPPELWTELRAILPRRTPMWSCGYLVGTSVIRNPNAQVLSGKSPSLKSIPNGFAPSIGFQNFEIAARCCAEIVFWLSSAKRARSGIYVYDYRDIGAKSKRRGKG